MNLDSNIQIFVDNPALSAAAFVVIVALIALKGAALWRAGRNNQRGWFIALLVINTAGLLEIVYLLTAGKKKR
ncbi:MAG: DUF5652 family protein [Microbacteriaceae bacterium]